MTDPVSTLEFFVGERKRLEYEAFLAKYTDAVLIRRKMPQEATTETTSTSIVAAVRASGRAPPDSGESQMVVAVRKKDGGVFVDRIGVGRTRATDLWFPVPDVSKYHAYFELIESRYLITDTGSKNGTYVNSERLKPRVACSLDDMAMLRFGGCEARFCSPTGFFHYLTKYI